MEKQFNYQEREGKIYEAWERSGAFDAVVDPSKKAFCVVMPPPNVTGILHMGHILDNTPQDIMTRWHRMRGFSALWIPGTDHAGIATQNVVKKNLAKEGIDYKNLGREGFLRKIWEWKEKHGGIITSQLKRLGCSCSWKHERFTMDEGLSRAVLSGFINYFKKGLVYKGKRMVNWCTICGTALSDDEVDHQNQTTNLWHLKYPIVDSAGNKTDKHLIVATTRPETMLGDTAVAIHPADERYSHLRGKGVFLPLQERIIPIVFDEFVDPKFGTGVVKVTPAHDPNDYKASLAHKLPLEVVIGLDGKMTGAAGKYAGLDRLEARKKIAADLEALGFIEKIEKYSNAVGTCYRCNSILEPTISDQWFVKMKPLAENAKKVVEEGKLKIVPDSEKHDYFHWMNNIEDWCISRQLWWGHRIPIYYCDGCGHAMAGLEPPEKCGECAQSKFTQDEDVLDTWFSSQLWPYSTLGWPEKTAELNYWYPNTWLMSGRDIMFFWDARMIMSGLELAGDIPFRTLALHGLVRDEHGRKLSKSLGNSPDPLALFDQYGTDAVRAAIVLNYPMGRQDTRLRDEIYKTGQGLVTKLWNASRLLLMSLGNYSRKFDSKKIGGLALEDSWILGELAETIERHDAYLENSDFTHALESLYKFFWDDFCDWYLEIIKNRMRSGDGSGEAALHTALFTLQSLIKLFHPYIPFVTEELWQSLRDEGIQDSSDKAPSALLISAHWPKAAEIPRNPDSERAIRQMMSFVRGARDLRHHLTIPPKEPLEISLQFFDAKDSERLKTYAGIACAIGGFSSAKSVASPAAGRGIAPVKFDGGLAYIKLPESIDPAALAAKIDQKMNQLQKSLVSAENRLKNEDFVKNAPPEIVEEARKNSDQMRESLAALQGVRSALG